MKINLQKFIGDVREGMQGKVSQDALYAFDRAALGAVAALFDGSTPEGQETPGSGLAERLAYRKEKNRERGIRAARTRARNKQAAAEVELEGADAN